MKALSLRRPAREKRVAPSTYLGSIPPFAAAYTEPSPTFSALIPTPLCVRFQIGQMIDDAIDHDAMRLIFGWLDRLEIRQARACSKLWLAHAEIQEQALVDLYGGEIMDWSDVEEVLGHAFLARGTLPSCKAAGLCLLRLKRFQARHPTLASGFGKVRSMAAFTAGTDNAAPWSCTAVLYDSCLTILGEGGSVRWLSPKFCGCSMRRVHATESHVYVLYTAVADGYEVGSAVRWGII